jgi:hypothetical protein
MRRTRPVVISMRLPDCVYNARLVFARTFSLWKHRWQSENDTSDVCLPACPCPFFPILIVPCWIKACGRKSKLGTNTCVYLRSTMHLVCRLPSTTSLPKLGLRLPSPWVILSVGRSERQPMPRNTSNMRGIWNCRLCTGKNRDPCSLDRLRRSFVQSRSLAKILSRGAAARLGSLNQSKSRLTRWSTMMERPFVRALTEWSTLLGTIATKPARAICVAPSMVSSSSPSITS